MERIHSNEVQIQPSIAHNNQLKFFLTDGNARFSHRYIVKEEFDTQQRDRIQGCTWVNIIPAFYIVVSSIVVALNEQKQFVTTRTDLRICNNYLWFPSLCILRKQSTCSNDPPSPLLAYLYRVGSFLCTSIKTLVTVCWRNIWESRLIFWLSWLSNPPDQYLHYVQHWLDNIQR